MYKLYLFQYQNSVIYDIEFKRRQCSEDNVQEFLHLVNQVTWQEVYVESDGNAKFSTFVDVFLPCYTNVFPVKSVHMRDTIKIKWITQGIKYSSKRMRLHDNQRKKTVMENKRIWNV